MFLATLAQHPGQTFSRAQLLDRLHGVAYDGYDRQQSLFLLSGTPANGHTTEQLEQALRANPDCWRNFESLAPGYRKQYVLWLTTAKRSNTRERRLREAIRLLASGRKLGMK